MKVRPTLGVATNFSKISSVSFQRYDLLQGRNEKFAPLRSCKAFPELSQIVRPLSKTVAAKPDASSHHDHSKLWTYEKALSAGLLVICPLGVMYPNVLFDILMAVSAVMHMHWLVPNYHKNFYLLVAK
uniref:Uncharacterized protein n=1 Tax=Rhodnius prolixus TaxID=13249 RepID=T1HF63_RHOPR